MTRHAWYILSSKVLETDESHELKIIWQDFLIYLIADFANSVNFADFPDFPNLGVRWRWHGQATQGEGEQGMGKQGEDK